ncbi:death-associated protein 1 isoform X10 [Apteryx rowi]|uniref:death-associated protein 1 isoform X10 n=1 Tax=Apteryx rowi TaxID=308060 RepID=UPI000E1CFF6D|nr:death-associated protein 1 isoform X10 [Apteryx rowi]
MVADWNVTHPVKAGGMRIVQKHPHNSDAKEEKDKDDQDWETSRQRNAASSKHICQTDSHQIRYILKATITAYKILRNEDSE